MTHRRIYAQFAVAMTILGVLGIGATSYIFVNQRLAVPFRDTYDVKAEFVAADGLVGGIGQPVNVVGVQVGQVRAVELRDGRAVVTMRVDRGKLAHVYGNARAALEPITPLHDMQVALDPGGRPASPLRDGATIQTAATNVPVPLSDLLSTLDADTRAFMTSLLASLDSGTRDRGPDIRRMLMSFGPTVRQLRGITDSLASRKRALARFVSSLAKVTRAASRDDRLATLVAAGNQTLAALAQQDRPLRRSLAELPGTLRATRSTLVRLQPFATELQPTVDALRPVVARLPETLDALSALDKAATPALRDQVRPLVRAARPVLRTAGPAVAALSAATPQLTGAAKTTNHFLNELAYNPPGDDEGFLFWLAWFLHNWNSTGSVADAHGTTVQASVTANCFGIQNTPLARPLKLLSICPK